MIILASIGITMILIYGSILNKPRALLSKVKIIKKLLSCSLCLGFWVGLGLSYAKYTQDGNILELIYLPFACASMTWLFDSAIDFFQIKSVELKDRVEVQKAIKKASRNK